ncbi:MAG: peptide deformylase [Helicobacteraceae bacterium]|nr:peptide deformylase [Helicobacteraceae bacterium]
MARTVILYPDRRLRQVSVNVEKFDSWLDTLLDDMNIAMLERNGVGLAAIQVGEPVRAFIVNTPNEEGAQLPENLLEIINPKIVKSEGAILWNEGCLSIPEYTEEIERFASVTLEYQDRKGEYFEIEAEGLFAIAIQHEMDHLDGKLFIDRLPLLKRKKFEKERRKAMKENG